ncbi:MAG: glycosyl transferase group 1 [Gemmatimonadetes bacterium]|nr:glycosyl transferase group 1 [Gemmatimonadota bacterium]
MTTRVLLSASPHNAHLQNIALAFFESGALGEYRTGGVDKAGSRRANLVSSALSALSPRLTGKLARRRVTSVPGNMVVADWVWELPRLASIQLGFGPLVQDWIWERSERRLDARSARLVRSGNFDVFFGVEHGALASITASREAGIPSVVGFLSPHHSAREKWVDVEYERFPELRVPSTKRILELSPIRDARRDAEARLATAVHASSTFTASTLVAAGIPAERIKVAALGCASAIDESELPTVPPRSVTVVCVGAVSATKGTHYLFDAWKRLRPGHGATLHVFGTNYLPRRGLPTADSSVVFHGRVGPAELERAYAGATVLVFPSLCDGFGMVVSEALAYGVPVITTTNAGAADLIEEGRNGFVVAPADADALAGRLEWCISHPDELLAMRRLARASATNWTWRHFRDRLRANLNEQLGLAL